jgi:hypothetical protein
MKENKSLILRRTAQLFLKTKLNREYGILFTVWMISRRRMKYMM